MSGCADLGDDRVKHAFALRGEYPQHGRGAADHGLHHMLSQGLQHLAFLYHDPANPSSHSTCTISTWQLTRSA
jgi:hypothetical protein